MKFLGFLTKLDKTTYFMELYIYKFAYLDNICGQLSKKPDLFNRTILSKGGRVGLLTSKHVCGEVTSIFPCL